MPQGPRSKQISASLAEARKRREEAARLREEEAKKKAAADLARKDEVRTTKVTNRRGRQTGTGYEKWDGKKWVKINKAEYDKLKKRKTTPVKETPTSPSAETKPSNAPPAVPPPPPRNPPKKEEFEQLRYPKEALVAGQDFVKFGIHSYKRGGFVTKDDKTLADKLIGTIILPIPSQIGDNNVANFGSGNLNFMEEATLSGATSLIGGDVQGAFDKLTNENLIKGLIPTAKTVFATEAVKALGSNITLEQVLARSQGAIINPNMELLFSGPGLRQFKFTFKFTPRDDKESLEVKKIIKAFKRNMAPKGASGNFLSTPNIFQINYMKGGDEHPFLNKFKLCALTNMSVNYTGDGVHATYYDGTPISMQMDLSFSELTPIYNEDYNEIEKFEKGHLGVGY
jgi:hypothetical protein